jgi:hypothetical protein
VGVRPYQFEILARVMGKVRNIKAGSYEIAQPLTPIQLLDKLTRGDVTQAEVRLIEGWTFAQFRAALDASPDLRHETKGLTDEQVLERLRLAEKHPEGLFFPDTYLFGKGSSDLAVLRRSYRAMQRHLKEEWEGRDTAVPYRSPYDALIMASIIEKETGAAGERDMIGGVLVNRLRIGMRLQVDPTIIYGLGATFDGNLKRSHLLEDGPYNTYTRADHVTRVIRPALDAGTWIVCDRFTDASVAYQGAGKGVPADLIQRLSAAAHPGLAPDRTFVFDCSYEVSQKRLAGKKLDRFEREDRAFFERVRVIDAAQPLPEIRKALEHNLADL